MSLVVQRGQSFGWLAWSINSSVGGVSGWSVVQTKCSCHRAMHSGSDVKVLPASSLIRVDKLRLPDRSSPNRVHWSLPIAASSRVVAFSCEKAARSFLMEAFRTELRRWYSVRYPWSRAERLLSMISRVAGVVHGFLGRERLLPKQFVAPAVMVFLKSSHWSVDSARAS